MTGMYPHAPAIGGIRLRRNFFDGDKELLEQDSLVDKGVGVHEYIKRLPELLYENGYFTVRLLTNFLESPWKFSVYAREMQFKTIRGIQESHVRIH